METSCHCTLSFNMCDTMYMICTMVFVRLIIDVLYDNYP